MNTKTGYDSDVQTRWLVDSHQDQNMVLIDDFSFFDKSGRRWTAKKGHIISGASIPRFLWSSYILGSPYVGNYRRATALHDSLYLGHRKGEHEYKRKECDKVMYRAMRADGTSWRTAVLMYAAVRLFGDATWNAEGVRAQFASYQQQIDFDELIQFIDSADGPSNLKQVDKLVDRLRNSDSFRNSKAD